MRFLEYMEFYIVTNWTNIAFRWLEAYQPVAYQ